MITICRQNAEEVRSLLHGGQDAYDMRLTELEDEVTEASQRSAEAEAASLTGDVSEARRAWEAAQGDLKFAQGRLRSFLDKYPDVTSYQLQDKIAKQTAQDVDRAVMLRLQALANEVDPLHERLKKAQQGLKDVITDILVLAEEQGVAMRLAKEVRALLPVRDRCVAVRGPEFQVLVRTANEYKTGLRAEIGGDTLPWELSKGELELDAESPKAD
ncbi:hypothetical protein [Pseudodesulfovibrio sp.]|uniref:hypothetical protein n=1 Tax=Pseudodesulfovibrio sp. TaxID=2035812 RepID=UPI00261CDF84|nr:hypothetical protein [Pseudodesulfovibrio sp.]MDD3313179.1 hypothetical protein [Pseudodesulfovibrio sp.]